jgi:16S rRNA (uracil1498-N3)-methyltransferase
MIFGPEGGLSENEISLFSNTSTVSARKILGPRPTTVLVLLNNEISFSDKPPSGPKIINTLSILRAETAPLYALSAISYEKELMG